MQYGVVDISTLNMNMCKLEDGFFIAWGNSNLQLFVFFSTLLISYLNDIFR